MEQAGLLDLPLAQEEMRRGPPSVLDLRIIIHPLPWLWAKA
jgi:hypothetical protein